MRLEDLDVFRAVHETGSFQRAAERVGLTQSAVTKVVQRLEDEFGVLLVERGARSLALTPAGRALYQRASEFVQLTAATRRDMAGEVSALRGSVRMGVVPALLNSVATPVLSELLASTREAQIQLSVKSSAELVRMVDSGQLDMALCFGVYERSPEVVRTVVARQRYRFVVRAGHRFEANAPTLKDLAAAEWLLPTPDVTIRKEIERMFADAGLGSLNIRVETEASATVMIPLLRRSDLVAVMAEQALQPVSNDGLVALDVELDALVGDVAVYHRRLTPSVGLLVEVKRRIEAQARLNQAR